MAKKLNDLLGKSIIIYAITNEFASDICERNGHIGHGLEQIELLLVRHPVESSQSR